ncbi:fumarate hydratase [Burkholderia thailandensis]|nr:fumarate hydratase [Burkholderia thailandensis]AWY59029.1 fumarate hydratase [Burkholderia thailandensis]AWY66796.1 fumarate hydratase [Burkholderia thailandensis]KVG20549.1 fumarate hydratase [Burkholderia thailandensis]NOK40255.1 fumarate hydratase [Burkholderia thailandensis]
MSARRRSSGARAVRADDGCRAHRIEHMPRSFAAFFV